MAMINETTTNRNTPFGDLIQDLMGLIMAEYRQVVEDDCLGEMMTFLDSHKYNYYVPGGDDGNDKIRRLYKVAYLEYVQRQVCGSIQKQAADELR